MWFDLPDDTPVDYTRLSRELRANGWVVLDASGKNAVDYGFERRKNRLHVYGVALYERDRDHYGRMSTATGQEIRDRLNSGDFYTPRPSGQARLPSDIAQEERFEKVEPKSPSDKSKRYTDTLTGEEISYREYAKRSGKAWAIKSQSKHTEKFVQG